MYLPSLSICLKNEKNPLKEMGSKAKETPYLKSRKPFLLQTSMIRCVWSGLRKMEYFTVPKNDLSFEHLQKRDLKVYLLMECSSFTAKINILICISFLKVLCEKYIVEIYLLNLFHRNYTKCIHLIILIHEYHIFIFWYKIFISSIVYEIII